jgi:hypothetical protein
MFLSELLLDIPRVVAQALAQYGCDQVYTYFHVSVRIFRYYILASRYDE